MASPSPAELAEKLEKSEVGRKKLRQAILLMQEKLDATENVLKVNESLRKECEQERQRAEDEKRKAEEEKRLRNLLEKESVTVKDQLAKVLQRLDALENKQKLDKKELERVKNEVKLSVQGVGASAEAMNAMQISFQTLEHGLLQKVNTAIEKANVASQSVNSFQQSLQNLENNSMKKINTALEEARLATQAVQTLQHMQRELEKRSVTRDNYKLTSSETRHISKKIVSDITQLFKKEKKSHRRIQHQLAALKTLLKPAHSGRSAEKKELMKLAENENHRQSSRKDKIKVSKKRKLMEEDETSEWIVNKKGKFQYGFARDDVFQEDIARKNEFSKCIIAYPSRTEHGMCSGYTQSLSHGQSEKDVPPRVCAGLTHNKGRVDLRPSNHSHLQSQDLHHEIISGEREECGFEEVRNNSRMNSHENLDRVIQELGNGHNNLPTVTKSVCQENSNIGVYAANGNRNRLEKDTKLCRELGNAELEESWWPGDITPLSPTLPEIHSPSRGEDLYLESVSGKASHGLGHPYVDGNIMTKTSDGCADTEVQNAEADCHFPRMELNMTSSTGRSEGIESDPKSECIIETCHVELSDINSMQKHQSRIEIETEADVQNTEGKAGVSMKAELNSKSDCKANLANSNNNGHESGVYELTNIQVDHGREIIEPQKESDVVNSSNSIITFVHSENQMVNPDPSNEAAPLQDHVAEVKLGSTHSSLEKQSERANELLEVEKKIVESQQHSDVMVPFSSSVYLENQILKSNASHKAATSSDHSPDTCCTLDEQNRGYPLVSQSVSHQNYATLAPPDMSKSIPLHESLPLIDMGPGKDLGSDLHTLLEKKCSEHQLDNSAFETVDKSTIDDITHFLDDLLPMPSQHNVCSSVHPFGTQKLDTVIEVRNEVISLVTEDENYKNNMGVIVQCSSSPEKEKCGALESDQQRLDAVEHKLILQTEVTRAALLKQCEGSMANASGLHADVSFEKKVHNLCLIQPFNFETLEVKAKVRAACINAIQLNGCFSSSHSCRETMNPEKKLHLVADSSEIPIPYVACSLISIVVGRVKVEVNGKDRDPKVNLIDSFIKVFISLVRTVFRDLANLIFESVFAQLGSFLNEGKVMMLSFEELESFNQDDFKVPMVGNGTHCMSFLYSEATLEDVSAGSKVLAGLCQVLSCVNHLQHVVYEILGCCDKDTTWLLTVFSSFASICGHTAFMLEADDLLGRAICSIIIELVLSVEQGNVESNEISKSSFLVRSKGFTNLIDILDIRGKSSVDDVLVEAMAAIQHGFGTYETVSSGSYVDPQEKISNVDDSGTYKQMHPNIKEKQSSLFEVNSSSRLIKTKEFPTLCKMMDWQKKYTEAVAALELISSFMGWEWTYNHLIIRWLWQIIASGTVQIQVAAVMHVVNALARIGVICGQGLLPGMAELRARMQNILNSVPALSVGESATYFSFLKDG